MQIIPSTGSSTGPGRGADPSTTKAPPSGWPSQIAAIRQAGWTLLMHEFVHRDSSFLIILQDRCLKGSPWANISELTKLHFFFSWMLYGIIFFSGLFLPPAILWHS